MIIVTFPGSAHTLTIKKSLPLTKMYDHQNTWAAICVGVIGLSYLWAALNPFWSEKKSQQKTQSHI